MDDLVYYNDLYDLYKNLLTQKQQEYFEDYYFNNYSLSEIAENYNISRNAISKQLSVIKEKLDDYEEKLGLYNKNKKINELNIDENTKNKIMDILLP
ncbi:MAG: hypothetical protein ILA19_01910 [Bacilli bacterium]|nr:hypothetical protein [Bacilli bacterium]